MACVVRAVPPAQVSTIPEPAPLILWPQPRPTLLSLAQARGRTGDIGPVASRRKGNSSCLFSHL